jgi:acetyl-CoA carboxylase biotin carboxyl carrier protein
MNQKELKELIEFLIEKDIAEFELERGDVKVRIKRGGADSPAAGEPRYIAVPPAHQAPASTLPAVPAAHSAPASPTAAPPAGTVESEEEAGLHVIKSPIVGTFYAAASPGAPPFVKIGDAVTIGQVLCIIEAMKLMNEIESDYAGELVKTYVTNAQPVEYGQPLFAVRTR